MSPFILKLKWEENKGLRKWSKYLGVFRIFIRIVDRDPHLADDEARAVRASPTWGRLGGQWEIIRGDPGEGIHAIDPEVGPRSQVQDGLIQWAAIHSPLRIP